MPGTKRPPEGEHPESRKKKITRTRLVKTCTRCYERKVKCDRNIPCGACVKLGESELCRLPEVNNDDSNDAADKATTRSIGSRVPASSTTDRPDAVNELVYDASRSDDPATVNIHPDLVSNTSDQQVYGHTLGQNFHGYDQSSFAGSVPTDVGSFLALGLKTLSSFSQTLSSFSQSMLQQVDFMNMSNDMAFQTEHASATPDLAALVLNAVLRDLPSKSIIAQALQHYFQTVNATHPVIDEAIFYDEFANFEQATLAGSPMEAVDMAWLSILCSMLAIGLSSSPQRQSNVDFDESGVRLHHLRIMHNHSSSCLKISDWLEHPRLHCLQAALMLGLVSETLRHPRNYASIASMYYNIAAHLTRCLRLDSQFFTSNTSAASASQIGMMPRLIAASCYLQDYSASLPPEVFESAQWSLVAHIKSVIDSLESFERQGQVWAGKWRTLLMAKQHRIIGSESLSHQIASRAS